MKSTTIQVKVDTKKKLEGKKLHPREDYDSVLRRLLEAEEIPSLEEMFREADKLRQKKLYPTKEVVEITHELRAKR